MVTTTGQFLQCRGTQRRCPPKCIENRPFQATQSTNRFARASVLYYRKIPKIISGAYSFQRPFLRGLYWEGNLSFKIGQAYTWREICVSKSRGLAYSQKEIYVSNLQKVLTETRLEDLDLSKTQPCKQSKYTLSIWTKEIQAKSEE